MLKSCIMTFNNVVFLIKIIISNSGFCSYNMLGNSPTSYTLHSQLGEEACIGIGIEL